MGSGASVCAREAVCACTEKEAVCVGVEEGSTASSSSPMSRSLSMISIHSGHSTATPLSSSEISSLEDGWGSRWRDHLRIRLFPFIG